MLFLTGLALGFIALKWRFLERFTFNSIAMFEHIGTLPAVGLLLLFPPLLAMVGAWYVLVAAGRTDSEADEQ